MAKKCLALDLGGTKLLIGIVNEEGKILTSRRYPSLLAGGAKQPEIATYMIGCIDDFVSSVPIEDVSCVGAGIVGRVDDGSGLWLEIEPGRCETVELAKLLNQKTRLPAAIDNDVRCALRAERIFGAGRGLSDFLYMNIGTGIAAAFVTGGAVIKGHSFNAGEVGHVAVDVFGDVKCPCGRRGCAEVIASGSGLDSCARALKRHFPDTLLSLPAKERVSAKAIFDLAEKGDALCIKLMGDAAEAAAALIMNLVWVTDPETVVLGGGIVSDARMFNAILSRLNAGSMRFVTGGIRLSALDPELTGLIGAAMCGFGRP